MSWKSHDLDADVCVVLLHQLQKQSSLLGEFCVLLVDAFQKRQHRFVLGEQAPHCTMGNRTRGYDFASFFRDSSSVGMAPLSPFPSFLSTCNWRGSGENGYDFP